MSNQKMTDRAIVYMGTPCNLACRHCYYAKQAVKKWKPLWWLLGNIILIRICRMNRIDLSGGEPTIYSKISFLIWFCTILGFKEIRLVTNGTQVEKALFLTKNKRVRFSVSLHSQNAEDLKALTGKNIFSEVVTFIKYLKNRINYINCVITPVNTDVKNVALGLYDIVNVRNGGEIISICFKHLDYNFEHDSGNFKRDKYREDLNQSIRDLYAKYPDAKIDMRFFPFCFLDKDVFNTPGVRCCSANTNVYDLYDWNPAVGRKTPLSRYIRFIFGGKETRLKCALEQAQIQSQRECTRTKKCTDCTKRNVCDGVQNGYLKIFGDGELTPQFASVKIPD